MTNVATSVFSPYLPYQSVGVLEGFNYKTAIECTECNVKLWIPYVPPNGDVRTEKLRLHRFPISR